MSPPQIALGTYCLADPHTHARTHTHAHINTYTLSRLQTDETHFLQSIESFWVGNGSQTKYTSFSGLGQHAV